MTDARTRTQGADDVNGSPFSGALQADSLPALSFVARGHCFLLNSSADAAQWLRGCAQEDHERTKAPCKAKHGEHLRRKASSMVSMIVSGANRSCSWRLSISSSRASSS